VRVEDDDVLRVEHVHPALQRRVVGVGDGAQHRADVERLLALRVRLHGEDLADARELAAAWGESETSRSTGSAVGAGRGKRSPGAR
jgi:hypothetical protein